MKKQNNQEKYANEHYKASIFYYNKDNPNPLVKKRYGFGFTFNWASPFAWIIAIGIIALIIYFTVIV